MLLERETRSGACGVTLDIDMDETEQELVKVLQWFATLKSVKTFRLPTDMQFLRVHEFFLKYILLSAHFKDYPPSKDYQYSFWKWAINYLESLPRSEACTLLSSRCQVND